MSSTLRLICIFLALSPLGHWLLPNTSLSSQKKNSGHKHRLTSIQIIPKLNEYSKDEVRIENPTMLNCLKSQKIKWFRLSTKLYYWLFSSVNHDNIKVFLYIGTNSLWGWATAQPIIDCHNSANEKLLCSVLLVFFNGLFVTNSPSQHLLLYKRVTFVSLELHMFCHSAPNDNSLLSSKPILLINSVIVSFFKVNRSLSVDLIYLKIIYKLWLSWNSVC